MEGKNDTWIQDRGCCHRERRRRCQSLCFRHRSAKDADPDSGREARDFFPSIFALPCCVSSCRYDRAFRSACSPGCMLHLTLSYFSPLYFSCFPCSLSLSLSLLHSFFRIFEPSGPCVDFLFRFFYSFQLRQFNLQGLFPIFVF